MSGVRFRFDRSLIKYIADDIEHYVLEHSDNYTPEIMEEFKEGIAHLRKACAGPAFARSGLTGCRPTMTADISFTSD